MGTTTFTGPIKAGNVLDTTGTTVGSIKNVGFVAMAQTADIVQSTTSAQTAITIPANSTIVSIAVLVDIAWSSATTTYTLSVGTSSTATELTQAPMPHALAFGRMLARLMLPSGLIAELQILYLAKASSSSHTFKQITPNRRPLWVLTKVLLQPLKMLKSVKSPSKKAARLRRLTAAA